MPRREGTCNQSESGKDRVIQTAGPGEEARVTPVPAGEGPRDLERGVPGSSLRLRQTLRGCFTTSPRCRR